MQRKSTKTKIKIVWLTSLIWLGLVSLTSAGELDQLVNQALQANPDLKSAEARYKSYLARVPQAGALPDPMFMFGYSNVPRTSLALDQMEMSGIELGLSQEIPFLKLGLMKKSARQMAESQKQSYAALKNFLVSQVKQNYYDLWLWQKSIEIAGQNKSLLENLAEVASVKYSVGEGLQQDVLKAQVEVSMLLDKLLMLEEQKKTTQAKLNILLNRLPQDSIQVTEEPGFVDFPKSETELQELALESNPELAGMQAMVKASQTEHQLAKREYLPDLDLGATYMIRKNRADDMLRGEDLLSFRATINLPLYFWSRQSKKVSETKWQWQSSQSQLQQMSNQVKYQISSMFYEQQRAKKQVELYQTALLPQARQSLESARAAYQVNKVDFLTLLDNQVTVLNYEIGSHQALTEYLKAIAQLEEMIGKSLQ